MTGIWGMETSMECGGAGVVTVVMETGWAGSIWGRRVGGPAVLPSVLLPARFILPELRALGPGGLPGPMLAPRGDIFCLDLGLDWAGRLPAWLNPILGPD